MKINNEAKKDQRHKALSHTKEHYERERKPQEHVRNYSYIWNPRNRVSIYFLQARERIFINALNKNNIHLDGVKILDIGCGRGNLLRSFVELGAEPENCFGVDILPYRIELAKKKNSLLKFILTDGEYLPFPDNYFDLIIQSTAFSSMENEGLRKQNAREIERVLKKEGYLFWHDMKRVSTKTPPPIPISLSMVKKYFANMDVIFEKAIHFQLASFLTKKSFILAEISELLPAFLKTSIFVVLRKK